MPVHRAARGGVAMPDRSACQITATHEFLGERSLYLIGAHGRYWLSLVGVDIEVTPEQAVELRRLAARRKPGPTQTKLDGQ